MIGLDGDGYDLDEINIVLDNLHVFIPMVLFFIYLIKGSNMSPGLLITLLGLTSLIIYGVQHWDFSQVIDLIKCLFNKD